MEVMPLILLINLNKDTERLQSSVSESSRLGIVFVRIEAKSVDTLENKSTFNFSRAVEACWASHLSALEFLVQSDKEYAVILEDDFKIRDSRKFMETLAKLETLKFDLVQLGFLSIGIRNRMNILIENLQALLLRIFLILGKMHLPIFQSHLNRMRIRLIRDTPIGYVPNSFQAGSHAYAISRNLAQAILGDHKSFVLPADGFLSALAGAGGITSFRRIRSLVGQKSFLGSMRSTKIRE